MNLQTGHFEEFFHAIHGKEPFPWQTRLLHHVLEQGWPETLSLPTATGKTAILDVAVFALALQADLSPTERVACRRIALIVDRRVVVDEASNRARRIERAIREAASSETANPIVTEVGNALKRLGGNPPLRSTTLRGGMYLEELWAESPLQPVILCSTVDQIGSRLLHRGYGLSCRSQPLHAGLLSHDTLIVLDEAHCSDPFLQTLQAIHQLRLVAEVQVPGPFHVVAMTATPKNVKEPFRLNREDYQHPVLSRRLQTQKPAQLVEAKKGQDSGLVETFVQQVRNVLDWTSDGYSTPVVPPSAENLATSELPLEGLWKRSEPPPVLPVNTVLVVTNRVATARLLYEHLVKEASSGTGKKSRRAFTTELLTGRTRPLDRERILERLKQRISADRSPRNPEGAIPLVVVATQCVEVGADFDFDALVTEACPLDALRQRLGRIDRMGDRGISPVVVICRKEGVGTSTSPADDPVYGQALSRTWHWLQSLPQGPDGCVDLGQIALEAHLPKDQTPLQTPSSDAPLLFPVYCDLLVQTGPQPSVSPDPSLFLHGPDRGVPEVQIVWRSDLDPESTEHWASTISLCPPLAIEALPVPLYLARAWLAEDSKRLSQDEGGDLPDPREDEDNRVDGHSRPFLKWAGPKESEVITDPRLLSPGDVLVVPCSYGGCDQHGWNPEFQVPVSDLAETAMIRVRRRPVLRVTPALWTRPGLEAFESPFQELAHLKSDEESEWPDDLKDRVRSSLRSIDEQHLSDDFRQMLDHFRHKKWEVQPHPSGVGVVILSSHHIASVSSSDDDSSLLHEGTVPLFSHMEQVGRLARVLAERVGLDSSLVEDVSLAARLHDLGKADPRFQAWMAGGDFVRARRLGLLAKSDGILIGSRQSAEAQRLAGYPEGGRHEILSVRLLESCPPLMERAHDRDLLLHLVAAHHGHARPLAPVVRDDRPVHVQVTLDAHTLIAPSDTSLEHIASGVAERFFRLIRRYGWWGLSFLESIVKLADYQASRLPEVSGGDHG
ncbi:MAG TPA: type I-U CRISPR-associated helicase/endonuclease Cas3 [Myxococcota bacterium]|nr:type I-U CRISPR-associated helicase/endonuclease Cas3 [Myxococcota bacterium]HQK52307.1 type I-U CRISPR-associated helicase/endonuclease Cas3 [Myxococcota bacterium]